MGGWPVEGYGRTDGVKKGIVRLCMLLKVKNTINTNQSREERDFFLKIVAQQMLWSH